MEAVRCLFACIIGRCFHRLITFAKKLRFGKSMGRVPAGTIFLPEARQSSPPLASEASSAHAMLVQLDGACPNDPPAHRMIGQGDLVRRDAGGDNGSAS